MKITNRPVLVHSAWHGRQHNADSILRLRGVRWGATKNVPVAAAKNTKSAINSRIRGQLKVPNQGGPDGE